MQSCPLCHETKTVHEIGNGWFECDFCGRFYAKGWSPQPSKKTNPKYNYDSGSGNSRTHFDNTIYPSSGPSKKVEEIYRQAEKNAKNKEKKKISNIICNIVLVIIIISFLSSC